MSQMIGVLVDRQVLRRALRGRPTIERIPLYRSVAADLKLDIVVFAIEDVSAKRRALRGYVPAARGWRAYRGPVPKVVHKRVLYRESAPLTKLRSLQQQGVILVNPLKIQDKKRMGEALERAPSVAPHLPSTSPYSWRRLNEMLNAGEGAILKPRVGSLGQGIVRVLPLDDERVEVCRRRQRRIDRSSLRNRLRALISPRRCLLQRYIPLARYKERPFDLRVPVQRDGEGRWVVPGMVAKVAEGHPFLTNMAQGGRAIPGPVAIDAAFGDQAPVVTQRVERLAVDVAKAVSRRHTYAADMGLDIGIDREGKPWLIEVNTRDQRYTFFNAGMHDTFRQLYQNPLAFCAYLAKSINRGKPWQGDSADGTAESSRR